MPGFLALLGFLLFLNTNAQIDQRKLDSLAKSIDSSAEAHKSWQDSFTKAQDSIYRFAIRKNDSTTRNGIAEQEKKKTKRRQQIILRTVICIVLFITGLIVVLRRKKQ